MRHPRLAVATVVGLIALTTGAIAAHTYQLRAPAASRGIALHQSASDPLSPDRGLSAERSPAATLISAEPETTLPTDFPEDSPEDSPTVLPTFVLSPDRSQISLTYLGSTQTIDASGLMVRVLDAVDCDRMELAPEQILTGQWFFPSIAIDQNTGNVALPVMLRECAGTQVSTVFLLDPPYAIYRAQVPGDRPLPDEFSTFPLNSITDVGYLGSDLLVKHGDASGSTALLVFAQQPTTPVGRYVGCVYTLEEEGRRLCPEDMAD